MLEDRSVRQDIRVSREPPGGGGRLSENYDIGPPGVMDLRSLRIGRIDPNHPPGPQKASKYPGGWAGGELKDSLQIWRGPQESSIVNLRGVGLLGIFNLRGLGG